MTARSMPEKSGWGCDHVTSTLDAISVRSHDRIVVIVPDSGERYMSLPFFAPS